ncbi:MAG: hypothetical protein QOG00_2130 [Pyrinomonadaceae bacterium]|nr:hypothetical protein [Pyrinomonadaceae bacterium]
MSKRVIVNPPTPRALHLAPLLTTLFVFATFGIFYGKFLQCPDGSYQCLLSFKLLFRELRPEVATSAAGYIDRVTWTLAGGLHLVVSLAAMTVSCFIIYSALDRHRVRDRWLLIIVTLLVAANIGLCVAILTAADVSSPAQLMLERTAARVIPRINFYNRGFDALGLTVGITLAVAACTIIWRNPGETQDERELMRRQRLLRALLYAGAAALVIGVLRLGTAVGWGGSFWAANTPAGKEASSLITGIVSSLGISYTLALASMYLPAMLVLNARAQTLAETESPDRQEEWLKKNGLTLSLVGHLPRLLALLGPVLVGPVGELLSRLAKLAPGAE